MNDRKFKILIIIISVIAIVVIAVAGLALASQVPSTMDPQDEDVAVTNGIAEAIPEDATIEALQGASAGEAVSETVESEEAQSTDTEESEEGDTEEIEDCGNQDPVVLESITTSNDALRLQLLMFLQNNGLDQSNFAVAFQDLSTGETCYFNELKQWDAASTYKLPLNLIYYDMEAAGQISSADIVEGTSVTLAEAHHQSLEFSNNEYSEAMVNNYGSYDTLKRAETKYMTLSDAETDSSYYNHNYYCARQMMDVAAYLYANQSQYQEALGYLEAAQPGQYFKRCITDVTIAQKYGQRDGYQNCVGIVFGSHPFALAVYSYNTTGGEPLVGQMAQFFYNYVNGTLVTAE